jgi:hypothetical protein
MDKAIYPETIPAPVLIRQLHRFGGFKFVRTPGFYPVFSIDGCALFPDILISRFRDPVLELRRWKLESEKSCLPAAAYTCIRRRRLLGIDKAKKSDLLCLRFRGGTAIER